MKQALLICSCIHWLGGCYPSFRIIQPRVEFVVQDPAGRPVEGATFIFATYRVRVPYTQVDRYQTNAAGVVSIRNRRNLELVILLPDAWEPYSWAYCVEKAGYRATTVQAFRPKQRVTVVLEPRAGSSQCKGPVVDERYNGFEVVE